MSNNSIKVYKSHKQYPCSQASTWVLLLGLSMFIIGTVWNLLFDESSNIQDNTDPIIGIMRSLPSYIMIIYAAVIAPVMEELGFRGWQSRKKSLKIISCILIGLYSILTFGYFIGIPILIIHIIIIFKILNYNNRIIGILFTSIIFTSIHWKNYSSFHTQFLASLSIFGLALIMSYITWRFSVIWSIIFHSIYNGILVLLFYNFSHEINIKTIDYEIKSIEKFSFDSYEYNFNKDQISAKAHLNDFIGHWISNYIDRDKEYFYINTKNSPLIDININLSSHSNPLQIVDTLIKSYGYQLDTIELNKYTLTLNSNGNDTPTVEFDKNPKTNNIQLEFLINVLKNDFNIPVVYDTTLKNKIIKINTLTIYEMNYEELALALKKGGINIVEDSTQQILGIKLTPISH